MNNRWKGLTGASLLIVLLAAGFSAQDLSRAPKPLLVVEASLAANPASFTGACPKTVNFKGTIKVNKACTLQYKFIRSDGASGPVNTLNFLAAGTQTVGTTWTLGKSYSGWEAIQVISPVHLESNHAAFTLTCTPKPNITNVVLHHYGSPSGEMDVLGTSFGAVQGTKVVQRDGAAIPGSYFWSDSSITTSGAGIIPWEHVYQFAIADGPTVLSNVFSKRFLYAFDGISPNSGPVGTEFNVYVWSLPAAPGGLVLKIGSTNCIIVAWNVSPGYIKAKVPPGVPAGAHDVYLMKGSDIVSDKHPFTVM